MLRWHPVLPFPALAGLWGLALAATAWSYFRRAKAPGGAPGNTWTSLPAAAGYFMLRTLAMLLLLVILAGPSMESPPAERRERPVMVYCDVSASMKEDWRRLLSETEKALGEAGVPFRVEYFASALSETEEGTKPSGTDLSLPVLDARRSVPRAVVLLSDGLANAGGDPVKIWRSSAGKVFCSWPDRPSPPFRLRLPVGRGRPDQVLAPGLSAPSRVAAGSGFTVRVRVEAQGGAGTVRFRLRGPLQGPGSETGAPIASRTVAVSGTGLLEREAVFKCPSAGFYLVEAEVEGEGFRERAEAVVEALPGRLKAVVLDGMMGWRIGAWRKAAADGEDEMDLSVFRLYSDPEVPESVLASAETIVLGAWPGKKDLPVSLRVSLRRARERNAGFLLLWTPSSPRWMKLLEIPGPSEHEEGVGEHLSPVALSPRAASELGMKRFSFVPVWGRRWRFGKGFHPLFTGTEGFAPAWEDRSGRTAFLQDVVLKALLAGKNGKEFLAALLFHLAGRDRAGGRLRISLSETNLSPGEPVEITISGKALRKKGRLRLFLDGRGFFERETGGGGVSEVFVVKAEGPGLHFLRAEISGPGQGGEEWKEEARAAFRVSGAGREDPLAAADTGLLSALAARSGGYAAPESALSEALPRFLAGLPEPQVPPSRTEPSGNLPLLWGLILLLLFTEWALRTR